MSNTPNVNVVKDNSEKRLPDTLVQSIPQNLSTITNIPSTSNPVANIQNTQPTQTLLGPSTALVGKPIPLDINSKLSLVKPVSSSNLSTADTNKITTLCTIGPTVRLFSPSMVRNDSVQGQQSTQHNQQIGTNIPSTYHVPRGPAAVANISTPRATIATPIVRSNTGQPIPISRPGVSPTVPNSQWQQKSTPIVYAQPQRHSTPTVSRIPTRLATTAVYSVPPARLMTPVQSVKPPQATVVTGISPRLMPPMFQTANNLTRLPVAQNRPPSPQVTNIPQTQPGRQLPQVIQAPQTNRPLSNTAIVNRIAVSAPIIGTANRVATVTSVQSSINRQLTISTPTTSSTPSSVSRIVIPQQQIQQQQTTARIVQAVTPITNLGPVSRVIATTTNVSNVTRVMQSSVPRITTLHPLPLTPVRSSPVPLKPLQTQSIRQATQLKQITPQPTLVRTSAPSSSNSVPINSSTSQPVQGQYLHPPHTTTYYSFEPSGTYSQYRQTSVQPVRLLVEPGTEEPHSKPNASPRPSILRKRDHDCSPSKGIAKNLVPILASMPTVSSVPLSSPPGSPKRDHDGGHSSGSTTVSATSSPGLDEDPEQSRMDIINPATLVEMSPRKKPRKQQLTGVELTESRSTEEEMQFITDSKSSIELKVEPREKCTEKKYNSSHQQEVKPAMQSAKTPTGRTRPTHSLLVGSAWKTRWGCRLQHYKRPNDIRPKKERRLSISEIAQQKHVLQKLEGWKIYHISGQMDDFATLEKESLEELKKTLTIIESHQNTKAGKQDDELERTNELIKGNMQRNNLISEGMKEARAQLTTIFQHKAQVRELLQRCTNKRAQKKRDK